MEFTRDRERDCHRFSIADLGISLQSISRGVKGKMKIYTQPTCFPPHLFIFPLSRYVFHQAQIHLFVLATALYIHTLKNTAFILLTNWLEESELLCQLFLSRNYSLIVSWPIHKLYQVE